MIIELLSVVCTVSLTKLLYIRAFSKWDHLGYGIWCRHCIMNAMYEAKNEYI